MSDNTEEQDKRLEEEQTLEQQQQGLFRELSREQTEAEKALEGVQHQTAKEKLSDESDQ